MLTLADRATWMQVTALGDSAVLMPCIALIALWLLIPTQTRYLAWRWLGLVLLVAGVVVATKLAFMVWLLSLPGLDFTGLSGHSALAMLVWPALGALVGRRRGVRMQTLGAALGIALALLVGVSRVLVHAHSTSEAVLGLLLGAAAVIPFLWIQGDVWRLPERGYVAVLSLLLVLPLVYGHRFPSTPLLKDIAAWMSGHPAHTRHDLHVSRHANP